MDFSAVNFSKQAKNERVKTGYESFEKKKSKIRTYPQQIIEKQLKIPKQKSEQWNNSTGFKQSMVAPVIPIVKQMEDTSRTLIPSKQDEQKQIQRKPIFHSNPGNMSHILDTQKSSINEQFTKVKNIKTHLESKQEDSPSKREIGSNKFKEYDYKSQIITVPASGFRSANNDLSLINQRYHQTQEKMERDWCSQIQGLPGSRSSIQREAPLKTINFQNKQQEQSDYKSCYLDRKSQKKFPQSQNIYKNDSNLYHDGFQNRQMSPSRMALYKQSDNENLFPLQRSISPQRIALYQQSSKQKVFLITSSKQFPLERNISYKNQQSNTEKKQFREFSPQRLSNIDVFKSNIVLG